MSYINLIQKDIPAITWSLDEDPFVSTTILPDRYLYSSGAGNSFYTGLYSSSSINAVGMPIVYGGKQSIKLETDQNFRVPSLDKMSIKDSRNSSSLEFWVKVNTTSSTEQVIVRKKDVDADQSDDYATAIYLKNDYVVFRLGKVGKHYEVSCPIDSINKPLHIVAEYSPSSISIIVNGVSNGGSYAFAHEVGVNEVINLTSVTTTNVAISAYIKSGDFDLDIEGDGEYFIKIRRFIPDFKYLEGNTKVTLFFRAYPADVTTAQGQTTVGPFTVSSTTDKIDTRARGRLASIKIENDALDTNWRYGIFRVDIQPDGRGGSAPQT